MGIEPGAVVPESGGKVGVNRSDGERMPYDERRCIAIQEILFLKSASTIPRNCSEVATASRASVSLTMVTS